MAKRFGNFLIPVAMVVGVVLGWANIAFFNQIATIISDLFLRLLKLISLPIIFFAITSTITGTKSFQEMRLMGRRVLTYTLTTTLIAATIALCLYIFVDPAAPARNLEASSSLEVPRQASYLSFLLKIIPSNFFEAFITENVMGIVFIALLLSFAILALPVEKKTFLNHLFSSLFATMIKMAGLIIKFMPLAIWSFIVLLVKELREHSLYFDRIMLYLICVIGANLIQGCVILPLFLKMKKQSPWKIFRGFYQSLIIAFFSKSSNTTLPFTIRCATDLGIKEKVSNFTLPLCSVVNMNGCAAFILITVLFVSSIHQIIFSPFDLISWIFIATFAAIGNAGVPMGCFFLTSGFLMGMDLPLYMMGLILPFYTILDMIETTLNVWSDGCITVAVNQDLNQIASPMSRSQEV
ncbi:MAG: cation:dicarboxylase symporter family transporter [Chlamydiales bacterium]